jgi:hypothetical protein
MSELDKFLEGERQMFEDWARYVIDRFRESMVKKGVGLTGDLSASLLYQLKSISGTQVESIEHSFNFYGRMVDMGVGRGQKIEGVKTNAQMIRDLGHGRKPKKWLSPTYYAQVATLNDLWAEKYATGLPLLIKEILTAA